MFHGLKRCVGLCVLAAAGLAGAQVPTLTVSHVSPATLKFYWPTNFPTASWQLMSTANLRPANWQPVSQAPFISNNAVVVLYSITNLSGYFRLQQIQDACVFQAVPPVINAGQSSTLTWCPQAGTAYYVSPGSGAAPGGSLTVFPADTTVYTLTASNSTAVTTTNLILIVNPCGWLRVTNWDATLTFSYALAPSTAGYDFSINHQANVTFHLVPQSATSTDAYFFGFATGGTASMNDLEVDRTASPYVYTTTEAGSGPPQSNVSYLQLHVTCTAYDFSYSVVIGETEVTTFGTSNSSDGVGTGVMATRPLTVVGNAISDSEEVPAQYPPSGTTYFVPDSDLGKAMFNTGVVNNTTAGTAAVSWTFTPVP